MAKADFWRHKSLAEMDSKEWESLCDGCARCCMVKLQDEASGSVQYTNVVCRWLDQQRCRCRRYEQRHELVPDCVVLDANSVFEFSWLPTTCAYRCLAEGRDLPTWHPLVTGDRKSVHRAGISVRGKVVSEENVHVDALDEHLIRWIETSHP